MINKYRTLTGIGAWFLASLMPYYAYAENMSPKTCFGLDSTRAYVAEQNLESVVQLITVDYDSKEKIKGTGFIVRASSGKDMSGYNRIMTSKHFIEDSKPFEVNGGLTEVYSANGKYLGTADIVATSRRLQLPFNANIKAGEVAVMAMKSVNSETAYRSIIGLTLAKIPPNPLLSAISLSYPSGISLGASGGPVLSIDGYVIGMVTNNIQDIKNEKVTIQAGDITVMRKNSRYKEIKTTLPLKSVAVMENFWDKGILDVLGEDALSFSQDNDDINIGVLPVITYSSCVVFQGPYVELKTWLEKFAFQ